MKQAAFLESLTQQFTNWQRRYKALRRKYLLKTSQKKGHREQNTFSAVAKLVSHLVGTLPTNMVSNTIEKYTLGVREIQKCLRVVFAVLPKQAVLCAIAVISLTGVMGHKLYNQPQLKVGHISLQTIQATYTSRIENKHETKAKRYAAASNDSVQTLMIDTQINQNINQQLQEILDRGNEIRTIASSFPYFDTLLLSISTQRYLRSAKDPEWQVFLIAIDKSNERNAPAFAQTPISKSATTKQNATTFPIIADGLQTNCNKLACEQLESGLDFDYLNLHNITSHTSNVTPKNGQSSQLATKSLINTTSIAPNADFTQALAEIEIYSLTTSELNTSALIARIAQAREGYVKANQKISQLALVNPEIAYNGTYFLDLSDDDWAKTQKGIQQSADRILTQGIPPGLPPNILENTVKLQIQSSMPKEAEPLATKVLLPLLVEPNLKKDEAKTQIKAERAAADVQPVITVVPKNTTIVRQGEKITDWDFQVLEHYGLIHREIKWRELIVLALVMASAVGVFVFVESRVKYRKRQSDRLLILLLTLSTPLVLTMGTPYTTWSALGLLLGSFYGSTIGITVVSLLLVVLPISLEMSKIGLIAGAAGAFLGSCVAHKLRSREELALLGVAIALTQGGVYLLLKVLLGEAFGASWYLVFKEALFFACSGLGWSIVALGLSPYLEQLFDLVTPIRLAELANPNRALLKRLAAETPGTFQHTLFVSSLAEAAARQLKCNVELVRAGTLYHDIGKMHDAEAFIENQMGRPNKHDTEINNPWISAEIIKKHVSEGLVIARKHRLPTAIQAFIPEHQGTMQIAYFYHQALQLKKENPCIEVRDGDFSYDGPIPQSRETGIVMLADSCEAALRCLKDATLEQALTIVNNILRARWQDNQLVDSGLTRAEMTKIGEIFVEVWQQFHHKRVAYPKLKACALEK